MAHHQFTNSSTQPVDFFSFSSSSLLIFMLSRVGDFEGNLSMIVGILNFKPFNVVREVKSKKKRV